jgi:hypothetical protein
MIPIECVSGLFIFISAQIIQRARLTAPPPIKSPDVHPWDVHSYTSLAWCGHNAFRR